MNMLPFEQAVTILAAVAGFVTVLAVWNALLWRDPISHRAGKLRRRHDELRAGLIAAKPSRHRRRGAMGAMRALAARLNLLKGKSTTGAAEKLARAGWRSKDALITFMVMKLILPFAFAGAAFALLDGPAFAHLSPILHTVVPLMAVLGGYYASDVAARNAIMKREQAIRKQLPDALDLLVICAGAGLSLDAALTRVAREMAPAAPEVADEIGLTSIELGFLPDRREALRNLTRRCQIEPMRGVVNTLTQTERYGTPLAHSLRVLASEYRSDRMLKAEAKAAKLPAVLTVPMIIFILPPLMIVLIGPGILRTIDALSKL
jgi:tight adherence protein C